MAASRLTLAREAAWWFFAATMSVQILVLAVTGHLVLRPVMRASADDLAGLMVRAATEYAATPPARKMAVADNWRVREKLTVGAEKIPGASSWLPYNQMLEQSLESRVGQHVAIVSEETGGGTRYRVSIPTGQGDVVVSFPRERIGTQPAATLLLLLLASMLVSLVPPLWLARRLTVPLASLADGAERIGQGDTSVRLPESGPVELVRLISAFNRMAGDLDELVRHRTTMLAGISHDLRTPIARCRMALELLREDHDPALIVKMERYLDDMNQLTGDFLEFAKGVAEHGGALAPLPGLLAEAASPEDALLLEDGVYPDVPAQAMRRVLTNLIINARIHGGGAAEIALFRDGNRSVVEIRDRGPGIQAGMIEAMFAPFVRGNEARTSGGTGLGLAVVRQLCRANGWQVQLLPRTEGGMVARVTV